MGKAHHVGVVQGGLDLVHHHEGGGAYLEDGKVEGNGHEGLLTAGQQGEHLQCLAGRLHPNLNAAIQDILRVLQLQGGLTASEELSEGLLEGLVEHSKLLGKNSAHLLRNIGDDALQLLLGLLHIVPLVGEVGITLVDALELVDGVQVDITQSGDGLFQFAHPALSLGDALQFHPLGHGCLVGQLVGLPQLVQ